MAAKGWHFHLMGEVGYRLMCSWATGAADIERFVSDLTGLMRSQRQ
jgi:threonine aldolase